jgi:hypothetical protein
MSSHLANIPEAVRIAASTDPSTDPGLKQQAIDYLNKVRELCEETWQVRPLCQSASARAANVTGLLVIIPPRSRCTWTFIIRQRWEGEIGNRIEDVLRTSR